MGSKVICPLCEQEGYLVFETRKSKTKSKTKIGDLVRRNIRHKKYTSTLRVVQPYASIIHRVKKNGKWKNVSHYLGTINKINSNIEKLKKILDPKISDKVWDAFKESIEKAKYDQFKDMDNPTNQVIAEIISLRKIPYVRLHDNTENEYHCPQCNKPIKLTMKGSKITLEELETINDF